MTQKYFFLNDCYRIRLGCCKSLSNHKLNIETGRYDKISRCDRICPVCSLDIEDEIYFLFDCANYSSIKHDFFNKIANRIPNYKYIPISTLIIQLMNSTEHYLNKQLVQYVTSCLEMRDNLLSKAWCCYLIYFLLLLKCFCNAVSLFYGPANKVHCCCCCCCLQEMVPFFHLGVNLIKLYLSLPTLFFKSITIWINFANTATQFHERPHFMCQLCLH